MSHSSRSLRAFMPVSRAGSAPYYARNRGGVVGGAAAGRPGGTDSSSPELDGSRPRLDGRLAKNRRLPAVRFIRGVAQGRETNIHFMKRIAFWEMNGGHTM